MKRNRSQGGSPADFAIYEDPVDAPLADHANNLISPGGETGSPRRMSPGGRISPGGLKSSSPRPSKIRRHGSKLLFALRSLTNSGKSPKSCPSSGPVTGKTSRRN